LALTRENMTQDLINGATVDPKALLDLAAGIEKLLVAAKREKRSRR
jgi:hypothetical protein